MIEIKQDSDGQWGGVDERGNVVIPFKYDEITLFDDKYFCRKIEDYIWIDQECYVRSRHTVNSTWVSEDEEDDDNDALLKEEDGVIYKYQKGKFGVLDKNKNVILPCNFDDVWRWENCDVIEVRTGTRYQYFDMNANPILTRHRYGPVDNLLSPYSISEQQNDIALMTMEFVDSCYDEQCCVCYGRPTRLDRILRQDVEGMMRFPCEYQRFPADAFHRFNGWDTYIYRAYIAHGKSSNPMGDCVRQLHEMRCYSTSWSYLDKVLTNENTRLSEQELELLQFAASDCETGGQTTIGYGIDNKLADGEVKVLHIEYFSDHWPNDEDAENEDLEADRLIKCLFPDYYTWKEAKPILEAHPDPSLHRSIWDLVHSAATFNIKKDELEFYYNAIEWGLKHGWDPNEPTLGETALECLNEEMEWLEKSSEFPKSKVATLHKIKALLQQYGGVTLAELRSRNPFYRPADFLTPNQ